MWKECQVVMLPAKNQSRSKEKGNIDLFGGKLYYTVDDDYIMKRGAAIQQHLYILSDDEIKEGDTNIWDTESENTKWSPILKILGNTKIVKEGLKNGRFKKIIATTDKSLKVNCNKIITDCDASGYDGRKVCSNCNGSALLNLPKPSTKFIKKYCELGGIDKVLVEYKQKYDIEYQYIVGFGETAKRIDLPDELKVSADNTIIIKSIKDSWNREEVKELIYSAMKSRSYTSIEDFNEWIKENL